MHDNTSTAKLNVLFIDDEPNVLSGLRRLLRSQRDRWDMYFCASGAEAIQQMHSIAFDVIVTDMRMPEMDGTEVLLAAKKHAPHALRCVLSGQADRDQILRVLESAHQFASKPCDTQLLEQVVAKSRSTKVRLANTELRSLVTSIHSLPILARNWNALLEELVAKNVSIDKLANIVALDVALSAKVLQLVNSSFFGQPKNVLCPKAATKLLGVDLFIELAVRRRILRCHEGQCLDRFSPELFAEESLEIAQIAFEVTLNRTGNTTLAQEAYLAGLLRGIGKLVLAEHFPEVFDASTAQTDIDEIRILGANHIEIGCSLLSMWGLPCSVIEAIEASQFPTVDEPTFSIASAIQTAMEAYRCHPSRNQKALA